MTDADGASSTDAPAAGRSRFGDGLGTGPDLVAAAEQAAAGALAPLGGAPPDLFVFFVSPGDGIEPDEVERAGLRAHALAGAGVSVGTTAHGVLGGTRGVERTPAVAAWAATLPGATITPMTLTATVSPDRRVSLRGLPDLDDDVRAAMLLADPYSFPVGGLLEHVNESRPGLPFVGGLASVPGGPSSNRLFRDGEVLPGGAVGVLFGGDVAARTVVSQGCRPIGPPMIVTRSDRNVLLELAGVPAGEKLTEIVTTLPPDEQENALRGLHVGIAVDEYAEEHERGDFLIRAVLGVEQERGGVVVGDVLDVGRTVRFQVRDVAGAEQDLADLLGVAVAGDPTRGALLFSCNGRGAGMFGTADHDVRVVRRCLGDVPVAGFFAAGEIGPIAGRNHMHGFTASALLFG